MDFAISERDNNIKDYILEIKSVINFKKLLNAAFFHKKG